MFKILSRSLILSAVILIQHFQHPNINFDLYTELVHLHYVKLNLVRISFSCRPVIDPGLVIVDAVRGALMLT